MAGGTGKKTDALTQAAIVGMLVAALYGLYYFAGSPESALDPRPMMALGFVVLASYAIGAGFDVVGLPHITGYLVAGIVFGPSLAHMLPSILEWFGVRSVPPPFDEGILSDTVIADLGRLDRLAIALIAMTAGGELKIDALRRGILKVLAVVGGRTVVVVTATTLFVIGIAGSFPAIALPGLGELTLGQSVALGLVVSSIAVATSPAAVIAVMTETRAYGEMTRLILSSVVFIDVVVVVMFGFTSVFAARAIGLGESSSGLASYLVMHIGGAIAVGVAVGAGMAAYLRFVGRQLLVFLLAVVFAVSYVAELQDLDTILLFLAAGFVFSNFSPRAGTLIHSIEQLSAPVYVVFFTLAGARLHLAEFVQVFPFAVGLALVRFLSIWGGTRLALHNAPETDPARRVGFLGFIAQAGVSLSLAAVVGRDLGEPGRALSTVLFGAIAINELVGPVLLKWALGMAGETGKAPARDVEGHDLEAHALVAEAPAAAPAAASQPEPTEAPKPEGEDGLSTTGLKPWRPGAGPRDFWGPPPRTASRELNRKLQELELELQGIVRDVTNGPLQNFRSDAEFFIRDLRREFLRHHRRLTVQARTDEERAALPGTLRLEQAKLADRWRGIVLGRSAKIGRGGFSPEELCTPLDRVADAMPEAMEVPWEDESFVHRESESVGQTARRSWLRWRRTFHKFLGNPVPSRRLELRDLARYYLSGWAPTQFEGIAALLISADRHLASRVRSVFDGIVRGYDQLATRVDDPEFDLNAALQSLRQQVDREISLALEELRRIHLDGTRRVASVLGEAVSRIKRESKVYGTLDLPPSKRNFRRLHRERTVEIAALSQQLAALRRTGAGGYPLLAMELEVVGLEARVKDAVEANVSRVEKEVKRRASLQAERVLERLDEAVGEIKEAIGRDVTGAEMATELRGIADRVEKVAGEASRIARELQTDLLDERKVAPLLDSLTEAAVALTGTYRVSPGRLVAGEYKLPPAGQPISIEFREQVLHRVESHVAPKLLASARDAAERVGPLADSLAELERLIAFNGELALAELEVVHDESVPTPTRELLEEMLTGHLERSRGIVQGYVNASRHWPRDLGSGMRDSVLGVLEELRDDLVTGEISEAKLAARRRAEGRGAFVRLVTELPQRVTESSKEAGEAIRRVLGDERLEELRARVGLPVPRVDVEAAPAAFAPPMPTADLPLVYKRLFAPDTMEAVDVIGGYEDEIDRASRALGTDAKGTLRTVMLIGSDGVGKGALAGAIVRSRRWKNVRRVQISEPLGVAQVDALFAEKGEGQLVVVDGIQWLCAMKPNGFAPLRRFVELVVKDAGKRAWLVNADAVFYAFASSVAKLEAAFPTRVKLRPLGAEELKAAILERQEMSGYAYVFDRSAGEGPLAKLVAKGASRWSRPYDRFFEDLHRESGGLVRDALRLWLASIQKIEGSELVHLGVVPRSGYRPLSRLPEKTLVALHQIVRQGWMDAETMAFLFRTSEPEAHAELARMEHLGLLQRQGAFYRIAAHLRGALLRVLEERGWRS